VYVWTTPSLKSPAFFGSTTIFRLKMLERSIPGERLEKEMSTVCAPLTVIVDVADAVLDAPLTSVRVTEHGTEDASAYRIMNLMPVTTARFAPNPFPFASYSNSIRPSASTVEA
jgi:hypothetical protein